MRPTQIRRSQVMNFLIMYFSPLPFPCNLLFIFVVQIRSLAIVAADGATVCHPNNNARILNVGGKTVDRETKVLGVKPVLVPLFKLQTQYSLPWDRTRESTLRSRRLAVTALPSLAGIYVQLSALLSFTVIVNE